MRGNIALIFLQARLSRVVLLPKARATEAAVRQEAPRRRYFHLATHGFFAPKDLRSALAPEEAQFWMLREGRTRGLVPESSDEPKNNAPTRVPPKYWAAFALSGDRTQEVVSHIDPSRSVMALSPTFRARWLRHFFEQERSGSSRREKAGCTRLTMCAFHDPD